MAYQPIDFPGLNNTLLERAFEFVSAWLPGGKRVGHEYVCADLNGGEGGSCSVNLNNGRWSDFASGDKGGDLVALYAAIHNLGQPQAAREIMESMGWRETPAPVQTPAQPRPAAPRAQQDEGGAEPPKAKPSSQSRPKSEWRPVVPVPAFAPPADFKHWHRKPEDLEAHWEYKLDGELFGYVVRYRTSDGGKDVMPLTWCEDLTDPRGTQKWVNKQWEAPRPLYVPATVLSPLPDFPVALVEGEKCAMAGFTLLPGDFDWVSWPGGGKAWDKARWSLLMGRTVYLWPDCDAKRVKLTAEERKEGIDPATKPLLPEHRQPGMSTMVGIATLLTAEYGCTCYMVPIPAPGAMADGWDVADAIAEGWDAELVRNQILRKAVKFVPADDAVRAKEAVRDAPAGASQDDEDRAWRRYLLKTDKLAIKAVRENVVFALDGIAEDGVKGIPEAHGVIAFNEFTNDIVKTREAPWGTGSGTWKEVDELKMGEWLVRKHWLPSMPRGTLEEAVRMVASSHSYHPVRAYLDGLQWDGVPRLKGWLRRACIDPSVEVDKQLARYLARAGTWFLQGMVARVMQPGVKFDYMLILEGPQGRRKSTLLKVLAGDYFADTGLVLGDKDSYQQLQGRWLYEFGELDSFGKAEVTRIKSFIASSADYFRASFDRRARDYPRQIVFGGTTNEDHYLTDPTGNRRFWPVRVSRVIDIDWVEENRDQLFAEAKARFDAGERMHPLPDEELELFEPQQSARAVENAIETAIVTYLYDEDQKVGHGRENGSLVNEISLVELLGRVGIGLEKLGPGRFHEKQAAAALRRLGWVEGRATKAGIDGKRPRVYKRPSSAPAARSGATDQQHQNAGASIERADDDCPF